MGTKLGLDRYGSSRCQYICTNILATDNNIFIFADIWLKTHILADTYITYIQAADRDTDMANTDIQFVGTGNSVSVLVKYLG